MKFFVLVSSLLLAASCPINPNPKPTPVPTPTPVNMTGPNCADNHLNCNCIDFPPPGNPTCVICDSSSPTGTKDIGIVPVCPPNPVPTPTPTPTPIPGTCSIPDSGATFITPRPPAQFSDVLNQTLQELYGGNVQSRVPIPVDMNTSLNQVVNALKKKGVCAGIQSGADEVCIFISPNKCQGYHTFTCDPGCTSGVVGWAPGSVRDTWVGDLPVPEPTPTPNLATCPSSLDKFNPLSVRDQSAWIVDATPQTCDRDWCHANGFPDRTCCPMGIEGDPQRHVCEQLFAPYSWFLNGSPCGGADCFNNNGNNLQERIPKPTPGGTISIKAANGVIESGNIPASN